MQQKEISDPDRSTLRAERQIVTLISAGHFTSHICILALPPLFLAIQAELEFSFTALGAIVTVFSLASASGQYPFGVLVDRYGARWFLIGGLTVVSTCMILLGQLSAYWLFLLIAFLHGIGDSVFHPSNYAVITSNIGFRRLGKAYAVHAVFGYLGFAAAPLIMDFLRVQWDWRVALSCIGVLGFAVTIVLFINRNKLANETTPKRTKQQLEQGSNSPVVFKSPAILMLFCFYVAVALSNQGIQTYSPSALPTLYDVNLSAANHALFLFLASSATGVVVGGYIADRFERLDLVATTGYLVGILMLCLVAAGAFSFDGVLLAFLVTGLMLGIVTPSRDLMVRKVSQKGSAGKAFGFVNSGFGYGSALGPLVLGWIMDTGWLPGIYYAAAIFMLMVIISALGASRYARIHAG